MTEEGCKLKITSVEHVLLVVTSKCLILTCFLKISFFCGLLEKDWSDFWDKTEINVVFSAEALKLKCSVEGLVNVQKIQQRWRLWPLSYTADLADLLKLQLAQNGFHSFTENK